MRLVEWLFLIIGTGVSIAYGVIHSIYGSDPHHWGFIMGTALDLIQGKKLFHEVYIQYGLGQPFFYQFLSFLAIPINFTTIGIITSIIYAIHLCVLYLIVRKIGGIWLALLVYGIAFLIHTYSIFPWPNYYSGLFLTCAIWIWLKEEYSKQQVFLAATCLFLSFLFRSTYLLSFTSAAFVYGCLSLYRPALKSKKIFHSLFVFYGAVALFFLVLLQQGDFVIWYEQSIGSGTSKYHLGIAKLLNALRKAFWPVGGYLPDHIVNTSFVIFFHTSVYFVLRSTFKKKVIEKPEYVFIALLGLAGLSQAILSYEVFRLQNDCMPIMMIAALVIKENYSKRYWQLGLATVVILLVLRFPNGSTLFPLIDGSADSFQNTSIPIFRFHRLESEAKKYYEDLSAILCVDDRKILNLTPDSVVPYLCAQSKNGNTLPFYSEVMMKGQTLNYSEKWIVVDQASGFESTAYKLRGRVFRPGSIRFFGGAEVLVYSKD